MTTVFVRQADGALQGAAGKGMQGAAGQVLHGQILGVISTQMWGEFDGAGACALHLYVLYALWNLIRSQQAQNKGIRSKGGCARHTTKE